MFKSVPEKVPEKGSEALVQSEVKLNRFPKKVPEKVWEGLVLSQQGSREGSREGLHGRLWCKATSGSTGF
jgi:hypothetical protein